MGHGVSGIHCRDTADRRVIYKDIVSDYNHSSLLYTLKHISWLCNYMYS